ncbi:MAG: mftE [Microbacteriaceae bacterium]|nr:mftE [Microbacteriaceae bacterium]
MSDDLATMAWPSVGPAPLVLVPLGSTEQHGPHLPFQTDTLVAESVARALAEGFDRDVIVAPAVAYGASGEHQAFPGTASVGHDALRLTIIELVRSLSTWAAGVVFVNGHGGNIRSLSEAVLQLRAENHMVAWLPCATPGGDAHAGRTETSLMLHLAPATVDLSRAEPGNTHSMAHLAADLTTKGVRAVSPNGILGDPTGATAAEGAELFATVVTQARRRLDAGDVDARGCLRCPA